MAADTSDHIIYYLSIEDKYRGLLGEVRAWENLKIATEGSLVWVMGFSLTQVESVIVQSIPYKQIYYAQDNKLFPYNSMLPDRDVPALLWTPIQRGIPIKLPDFNHNYFGVDELLQIKLVPSKVEQQPYGLLCELSALGEYIKQAPAIRLASLVWVRVEDKQALILGTPFLPIEGTAFWKLGQHLLPLGYEFEEPLLQQVLTELLDETAQNWMLWDVHHSFSEVKRACFQKLSISSYRLSISNPTPLPH